MSLSDIIDRKSDDVDEDELLKRLMFRDLLESKIDVRTQCAHCEGKGVKHGDECPVCDGDKVVNQSMSLYNLGQKLLPLILFELKSKLKAAEQSQ